MKTLRVLVGVLFLSGSLTDASAQRGGRDFARAMIVDAEVQEQFFAKYSDLAEERDVVAGAARQLVDQGAAPADRAAAEEALATRARTILELRTPQEWQHKAVRLYPELGVAGSDFNQLFLKRYQELKTTSPQFEQEPSWPVLLAKRCADELRIAAEPAVAGGEMANKSSGVPTAVGPAPKPVPRMGFWLSLVSVVLLLAISVQPALWLFRVSRAFAGVDGPVTLWQRALRPAAWSYLAVALLALFRTFGANADLGFIDRFGITLLVSVLAGAVVVPLAFAVALGVVWWLRRAASRAETAGPAPDAPAAPRPRVPVAK